MKEPLHMPAISVVMPLYNKGNDVNRSVCSALAQSFKDFELIIVNDGSTDNGPEVVRNINDDRIRIIDQENRGVSAARNRGIQEAKSDLIAFLDADDEWHIDFLDTIFTLKEHFPECSVFATNYVFHELDGSIRHTVINGLPEKPWQGVLTDYFRIAAHSDPPLWSSAVAVKKEALISVGCFTEGITSGEDLLTWARLVTGGFEIAYDSTPHAMFWVPTSVSSRPARFSREEVDIVGDELNKLVEIVPEDAVGDLLNYIAHWHIMRSSTFIELGWNREALREIKKSIKIIGYSQKSLFLLGLACLPDIFSKRVHFVTRKSRKLLRGKIKL